MNTAGCKIHRLEHCEPCLRLERFRASLQSRPATKLTMVSVVASGFRYTVFMALPVVNGRAVLDWDAFVRATGHQGPFNTIQLGA